MAQSLAAALARAAVDLPAVASVDDAQRLAGPGDYWDTFGQIVASALTPALATGAAIGVDEAQHDATFSLGKLAKVDVQIAHEGGAANVGINWDLVNTQARDWASAYSAQLVTRIADVTRARIQAAITSFIDTSEDIPDLARRIRKIIDDPKRAQLIAQTESTRSFAEGNTLAWTAQGIQGRKWFNVEDALVCPICRHLGGQVAKLGQPFKGPDGQDIDNPPGHPGCRCYVQPVEVVKEKAQRPPAPKPAPGPVVATPEPVPVPVAPPAPKWPWEAGYVAPAAIGPTVPGDGPPVSAALDIDAQGLVNRRAKTAIEAINSVHTDGELIPIKLQSDDTLGETVGGQYEFGDTNASPPEPRRIAISPGKQNMEVTVLHEVGHYLDNVGLSGGKDALGGVSTWGSYDMKLLNLRGAISDSEQTRTLDRMRRAKTVTVTLADGSTQTVPTHTTYIDYLKDPREQFARAYAQYIITKTADPFLMAQLDGARNNPRNPYPTQWSDEEFKPILAEFDRVFLDKGWIKEDG